MAKRHSPNSLATALILVVASLAPIAYLWAEFLNPDPFALLLTMVVCLVCAPISVILLFVLLVKAKGFAWTLLAALLAINLGLFAVIATGLYIGYTQSAADTKVSQRLSGRHPF